MAAETSPSISETAFSCPHCGALTTQTWFSCFVKRIDTDTRVPLLPDPEKVRTYVAEHSSRDEDGEGKKVISWADQMENGLPFTEAASSHELHSMAHLHNVFPCQCFNCKKFSLWVHDRPVFPQARLGAEPSQYLPEDVRRDFDEARSVLGISPRSAAALLRLAIQKLCTAVGEKGKNIDADIASLVKKGLDTEVQIALDSVRVIGNEAVHPGQMDLHDDTATAAELFDLVNFIADQLIGRPQKLRAIYEKLPEEKRAAIDARNAKALAPPP